MIIISEEYAKKGIYDLFDYFTRNPELLKKMYLAITKDIYAYKALASISPLEMFSSKNIISNIETNNTDVGNTYPVLYSEALLKYVEEGFEFVIPTISLIGDIDESTKEDNIKDPISKSHLIILNLSMFNEDKLKYYTDEEESKGINIKSLEIIEEKFTVSVDNIKSKIKFKLKNNIPTITIETKYSYEIIFVEKDLNIKDEKIQKEIKNIVDNNIKTYINKTIDIVINNNTDVIVFGNIIFKNKPEYYNKNKDNYLEQLKFNITVNSKLVSSGELTKLKEK